MDVQMFTNYIIFRNHAWHNFSLKANYICFHDLRMAYITGTSGPLLSSGWYCGALHEGRFLTKFLCIIFSDVTIAPKVQPLALG